MITGSVYYFTRSAIIFLSYHTVSVKRLPTEGASGHVSSGATSVKMEDMLEDCGQWAVFWVFCVTGRLGKSVRHCPTANNVVKKGDNVS